ncbi:MAG: trypsin-like peptidase domain-containing protein [Planctomycetota bacterium]|nr:trypsin-like peptidase domain-containing protein [Planctomycetota bacterium]
MRIQLLHLDGPHRGRTITYDKVQLLFGTSPDADVRYTEGVTVRSRHLRISFSEQNCAFFLKALEGEVFCNHHEVEEVVLQQNDLIEIGRLGPKLRFRVHAAKGRVCKPVAQMIQDAREVGKASGVYALTKSMRDDLLRHATTRLKVSVPLVILLGLGAAYLVGRIWTRPDPEQAKEIARLEERLAESEGASRTEIERLKEKLAEAEGVSRTEIERLRAELARQANVVNTISSRDEALKQVLETYSRGVCLIHGIFTLDDKAGKPVLGPGRKPVQIEYTGSGFLASAAGHVITNRHVVEPWWRDARVQALMARGFKARFLRLEASFPGRMPIAVDPKTIRTGTDDADVAVVRVDVRDVPVLPLHAGAVTTQRGGRAIVLGYPTGVNALLARAERGTTTEVLKVAKSLTGMIRALAKRNAISPIITQGSLNEVTDKKLVYDASTTSGGSGGPVFGPDGTVIGVNFAITRNFGGSNFGVPIRFARALLP